VAHDRAPREQHRGPGPLISPVPFCGAGYWRGLRRETYTILHQSGRQLGRFVPEPARTERRAAPIAHRWPPTGRARPPMPRAAPRGGARAACRRRGSPSTPSRARRPAPHRKARCDRSALSRPAGRELSREGWTWPTAKPILPVVPGGERGCSPECEGASIWPRISTRGAFDSVGVRSTIDRAKRIHPTGIRLDPVTLATDS
jgi:hypothetical protein